jgi:hypothetical protein
MYSWSISHILEQEFFCLGRAFRQLRAVRKKVDLSFSEQLLRVVFQTFGGQKVNFFLKYVASALKSCIKKVLYIFFFFLNFWGVKIGCHSHFNPECNTERGFIDSQYIALGFFQGYSLHKTGTYLTPFGHT